MFLYNYILLLKKIAFYEINKLLSVFTYDWVNLTIKNIGKLRVIPFSELKQSMICGIL